MPAQFNGKFMGSIPIRIPSDHTNSYREQHKHSRSSYSESPPLATSRNNSMTFRLPRRLMPSPDKTIAIINASGRQAASFIRVATAVGYHVHAQLRNLEGVVATEVSTNPNVTCFVGELYTRHKPTEDNGNVTQNGPLRGVGVNHDLISNLFHGAQLAFINTIFYGDEAHIGKALADAAKKARIRHFVYSSMPDHAAYNPEWPSLPLWAAKHKVEDYIFKDGVKKWHNKRIALAYEYLSPKEACALFSRGLGRPVRYVRGPIELKVRIPTGYREQLDALEKLFPVNESDPKKQPPYFGDVRLEERCPREALELWEGPRGLEEYAREMFPLEEEANGLTWMFDDDEAGSGDDGVQATATWTLVVLVVQLAGLEPEKAAGDEGQDGHDAVVSVSQRVGGATGQGLAQSR
ncbi:hypothetical protein S40288_09482 [Stachybotrys chartarum IBT 40288]|nr:hypothetical protein S40288_09482 [Stachybotrys chartarum IBT 40288]